MISYAWWTSCPPTKYSRLWMGLASHRAYWWRVQQWPKAQYSKSIILLATLILLHITCENGYTKFLTTNEENLWMVVSMMQTKSDLYLSHHFHSTCSKSQKPSSSQNKSCHTNHTYLRSTSLTITPIKSIIMAHYNFDKPQ